MNKILNMEILSESTKLTFIGNEVAIIIAYLIIISMYQIVIQSFDSNDEISKMIKISFTKKKLDSLKKISFFTSFSILVTSISIFICGCLYVDYFVFALFIITIIFFTKYLISLITSIINNKNN